MKRKVPALSELLFGDRSSLLQSLARKANVHRALADQIHQALPADLQPHCCFGDIRENTLYLIAETPAWASRARFAGTEVIKYINDTHNYKLTNVKIRVGKPNPELKRPSTRQTPGLSEANADLLMSTAKSIKDRELRNALARLASKQNKP